VGYAVAPQRDAVLNALIARLRLGRRWRSIVAAGAMNECTNSPDADWRDTFRRRLERSQVATDPDEVVGDHVMEPPCDRLMKPLATTQ
jgi:hypothetical protein